MNPTLTNSDAPVPTDYRSFFERSPALLCTAGFDGAFIEVNDAFARALGFEVDELLVHSITELVHPADRAATLQAMADVAGGADVCFDNRCRRRDGAFCWLSWSVRADAEHQLLYCSARDVTELRDHADVVDPDEARLGPVSARGGPDRGVRVLRWRCRKTVARLGGGEEAVQQPVASSVWCEARDC